MLKINAYLLKELKMISGVLVVALLIMKIVFYKENLIVIIKLLISIFWTFMLPGYLLLYYWHEHINLIERLVISFPVGMAIIGITSYYLGILGIHTRIHHILIPIFILVTYILVLIVNKRYKKKTESQTK